MNSHSDRGREALSLVSCAAPHSNTRRDKLTNVFTTADTEVVIIFNVLSSAPIALPLDEFNGAPTMRAESTEKLLTFPSTVAELDSDSPDWGERNAA